MEEKQDTPYQQPLVSSYLDSVLQIFLWRRCKNFPKLTRAVSPLLACLSVLFDFVCGIASILEIFFRGIYFLLNATYATGFKHLTMSLVGAFCILPVNLPMTLVRFFQRSFRLIVSPEKTSLDLLDEYITLYFEFKAAKSPT